MSTRVGVAVFDFILELQLCIGCRPRVLLYIDMVDGCSYIRVGASVSLSQGFVAAFTTVGNVINLLAWSVQWAIKCVWATNITALLCKTLHKY